MKKHLFILFLLSAVSFAVTKTQTDWSGGSGVPGPVTDWGNSYSVAEQINDTEGTLHLMFGILASPVEQSVGSFDDPKSVYATDVDGDGDIDVLGAVYSDNEIIWLENTDGTGTSWTEHTVSASFNGARSVYATDIDGDGDTDVLGAAKHEDNITWWENTDGTGTSWMQHTVDGSFTEAYSVFAIDIDGDGDTDVLGADNYADDITWWENTDGAGTLWTEHTVDGAFDNARSVYAEDVDGDGDIDVLGAAYQAHDITWWENSDTGAGIYWTEHTVDGSFGGASSVYAIDVDGDGDVDVLGAARLADDITWWENSDGTGTSWIEHTVEGSFNEAISVYATDLDGDGDIDVLGAAHNVNDITWWENTDGTGTSWAEHAVATNFEGAISVYAADVDGDGHIDVLGAAENAYNIAWWDLMGYSATGALESSILDAGTVDYWENFTSSGDEPAGTSLGFQFRSSLDPLSMGAWSDTVFANTSLSGILTDSTDFLQYRVILQTTDPTNTPVLNDVSFSYTTIVGVADDNTGEVLFWNLAPYTNPSFGNFAVQVSVPQSGLVDLVLHDITGRVIAQYSQELPGGTHAVSFNNLAEGVYFCTMHAEDFTATERVVVLKQ